MMQLKYFLLNLTIYMHAPKYFSF